MYYHKENQKENKDILTDLSDEDLISETVQVMWKTSRSRDKHTLLPRLQRCHDEIQQRQKPHLWNKAKDCFAAYQKKEIRDFD